MKKKDFKELKKSLENVLEHVKGNEILKKTLVMVDKSAKNFKKGNVGKAIDIDKYKEK